MKVPSTTALLHLGCITLVCVSLTSCEKFSPLLHQRKRKAYAEALQYQATGDFVRAAGAYEQAIDGTKKTAEAHFRLALLYNEKLHDSIGAVHHFRRYLALLPAGRYAREAKANLDRTEMTLATSLGGGTLLTRSEAIRLKNENVELQKQVSELQSGVSPASRATNPQIIPTKAANLAAAKKASIGKAKAEKDAKKKSKTYVVHSGDTLSSIARHFYKNRSRWKDIQDANINQLGNPPKKLKPGMKLIIP